MSRQPRKNLHPIWSSLLAKVTDANLTFAEIGRAVGVTRSTAYLWFNAESQPTLETVSRVAELVGCELQLIDRTAKPKPKAAKKTVKRPAKRQLKMAA